MAQVNDDFFSMSLQELLNVEVFTASLSQQRVNQAPGSITVISRSQIEDRGYTNLMQVLQDLPGIQVQNAADAVTYNRYTIRGVSGNEKFIILRDGIRISAPAGEAIPIADNFPLYNVKQVEMLYGPSSALYGADAFTGVINLITYSDDENLGAEARLDIGENKYGRIDFNGGFEIGKNTYLRLGGHTSTSDNSDLAEEFPELYPLNDLNTFSNTTVIAGADRQGPEFSTQSQSIDIRLDSDKFSIGFIQSYYEHSTALGIFTLFC